MATTPINNIIRAGSQARSVFWSALPFMAATSSWNQGDLLTFSTATNTFVTAVTGQAANLLGVAVNTIVNGVPKSPYQGTAVDASEGMSDMSGPAYGVAATFFLDTGSTLTPGQVVYFSTVGPQNVTPTQPGSDASIGVYTGSQGTITGSVAGQKVDIQVGARYGMTSLNLG